jgi:hypothetical protein
MRLCPHPSPIHSVDPDEVWHYINKLTSFDHTTTILKRRVNEDFFGFGQYINKIIRAKLIYNSENLSSREGGCCLIRYHILCDL